MGMYDYKFLLVDGVDMHAAASTNSTNEVNFGVTTPGFKNIGAHIVITQAYTDLNSGTDIHVKHGAATAPTTRLVSRRLTQTQMKVLAAHYFIPIPPNSLLQYARLQFYPVSETSTLGKLVAWLGPDSEDTI